MLSIFKKKKISCHFCKTNVDRSELFVLKYKAADGSGSMNLCKECAAYLNNIVDVRESVYEKDT
jgi:hypothetical protein